MQLLVVKKALRYTLLVIFVALAFFYELYLIYFCFTNYRVLGTISSPYNIVWSTIVDLLLLSSLSLLLITGFIFATGSIKGEDKEVKLKGKFFNNSFFLIRARCRN